MNKCNNNTPDRDKCNRGKGWGKKKKYIWSEVKILHRKERKVSERRLVKTGRK